VRHQSCHLAWGNRGENRGRSSGSLAAAGEKGVFRLQGGEKSGNGGKATGLQVAQARGCKKRRRNRPAHQSSQKGGSGNHKAVQKGNEGGPCRSGGWGVMGEEGTLRAPRATGVAKKNKRRKL